MKKTFHIGETCIFGTAKIEETTEDSVTIALYMYKTNNKKDEKTFYDTMTFIMWLGDKMDSYNADKIIKEIKNSDTQLRKTSMW